MRTRSFVASLLALASLAAARPSRAQDALPFSERAQTVIVLDNLGGFVHESVKVEGQNATGENVFGLFPTTPLARIGVHRFIVGGLSVGAGLIYAHEKLNLSTLGGDIDGATTLGIAPRIGYAIPSSASSAFWLRAGFTYTHSAADNTDSTRWQLMPAAEAFLVLTPAPHFGITLGPFVEYGVVGNDSVCSTSSPNRPSICTDHDLHVLYVGLSAGLLADF